MLRSRLGAVRMDVTGRTLEVPVLFRDEALVVVNKPSGMAVHRGWGAGPRFALQWVRDSVGQHVFPVHRLDQPTSGALLFALSSEVAATLALAFREGRVSKRYLALVRGVPPAAGLIDHPVPRERGGPRVEAQTEFRLRHAFPRYALVEARPLTGRLHQIRRHLKHLSHPIIGDVDYGKGEHNRLFREAWGLRRLALHAFSLGFEHPLEPGRRVEVVAPLLPDLAEPLGRFGAPAALLASPEVG